MRNNNKKTVGYIAPEFHNAENGPQAVRSFEGRAFRLPGPFDQLRGNKFVDSLLSSKQRTFWTLQISGWLGYYLARTFQGMVMDFPFFEYASLYASATVFGFLLTLLLRLFYQRIKDMALPFIVLAILSASAGLGAIFSTLEITATPFFIPGSVPFLGVQKLGNAMFESTVIFAWSAIYFGYHYYESFQEQKEQALKANALAHQAQLQMLRYQLNPHFLFNTLNAISTLVLDKSEADANRMLTKLSSFLRYTLVNQPTQRVTLDQELHALSLYLDIEKVRFQDRLVVDYEIDEGARAALVPNLILQPLIENTIKYAIAPSVDGGTITICAKVVGDTLTLALKDNGPGMADVENIVSQSGSGVGLVNTKERLHQIYGDDHDFKLENLDPTGLGVFIKIPCERKKAA